MPNQGDVKANPNYHDVCQDFTTLMGSSNAEEDPIELELDNDGDVDGLQKFRQAGYVDISLERRADLWASFLVNVGRKRAVCIHCVSEFDLDPRHRLACSKRMSLHVMNGCGSPNKDLQARWVTF